MEKITVVQKWWGEFSRCKRARCLSSHTTVKRENGKMEKGERERNKNDWIYYRNVMSVHLVVILQDLLEHCIPL